MSDPSGCTLCDLPLDGSAVTNDAGQSFCCPGCRDVYTRLDGHDDLSADASPDEIREVLGEDDQDDDSEATTHLRIEGMHCATCEAFIEARASQQSGVDSADASYITDAVRVGHDADVDEDTLCESLSGLGYRAYPRDDPLGERQAGDEVFLRLVVGVLFGMMVMMNYVVLIYPTYFESGLYYAFLGTGTTDEFLAEMLAGQSATYFYLVVGFLSSIVLFGTGGPILKGAYVSLRMRQPNMDLLVALAATSAWVYSTLAIALGGQHVYYDVTVGIIVVVTAGSYYESQIKQRATDRLASLTEAQVEEARRYDDGATETVDVAALEPGDSVLVREGERVPVDGTVSEGEGTVDEAVVTGESLPVPKRAGDEVVGGSLLQEGSLVVDVGDDVDSSIDRLTDVVWNLQSSTHGIQQLADRLATIFVPLVLGLAILVGVGHGLLGTNLGDTLLVALTVLIVSCPCALGLATPLAIAASVREALERGIVVFDETIFERLRDVDVVVFDKTGTLTTGEMHVRDATGPEETLQKAALLEDRTAHPIAAAIADEYAPDGASTADDESVDGDSATVTDGGVVDEQVDESATADAVESFESYANGVGGVVDGTDLLVGHPDLFAREGWTVPDRFSGRLHAARDEGNVPVLVGEGGTATGLLVVGDDPRPEWKETVRWLDERGIEVAVLTGDEERAATAFGAHPGVDHVFAGVPPEGKAETVARLGAGKETVMVGDGTNDAPALATADLGIALGSGTALAADAADVAIVTDDLSTLETVFALSRAANTRVKQNIGWAFCYNAIAIPLAVTGLINPLFAAVAMAGSSLLVVTNSTRALLE